MAERRSAGGPGERLSRLSEASRRICESLDVDVVLREVVDSARALTGAPFGGITTLDESGAHQEFVTSGVSPEHHRMLEDDHPHGFLLHSYLSGLEEPLRVDDYHEHVASLGLSDFMPVTVKSFLSAPIRHGGETVGNIHLAKPDGGGEFSREDEETVVMFASQAALVIANARRYRDEQRARADLETLIDTSPVGVVVFDAKTGAAVSFNAEAERIVGGLREPKGPSEDVLGALTFRRADGREVSLKEFLVAQTLSTGETVRAEEVVVEMPDGRSVTTLVNASPIAPAEGEGPESVVVTFQDMTPVAELQRQRAEFLGLVSHELRTPLAAIRGAATTMLDAAAELDPAELRQFQKIVVEQSDRMRELISDLLDIALIETGELALSPQPADLAALVDQARNTFAAAGGRNNIQVALGPDLPLVKADRRRVVQVLNNLLSNAARNCAESSPIRVVAEHRGVHVAVSVSDDGRGIPADRLPYLFRKFARAHGDDQGSDTGLGLAICKGIVESHGGRIWAESDGLGLGARFTFTLPAVDPASPPRSGPRERSADSAPADGAPRVLVVDDDPQMLMYVRSALARAGYEPTVTAEPEDALRLTAELEPQLVLMDLMLPGKDGIDLMREILDAHDVPVIFLSAYGQDHIVARAYQSGAADYVVKPFSPTELTARIEAALRKQAAPHGEYPSQPTALDDLVVDYTQRTATLAGRFIDLTDIEFRMLAELASNAGKAMTHQHLHQRIWGGRPPKDSGPVRTIITRLRSKLGDDADNPAYIHTLRRVGYRMADPRAPGEPSQHTG